MRYMLLGGFGHVGSGILDGIFNNFGGCVPSHPYVTPFNALRVGNSATKATFGYVQEICVVDNMSNPNAVYMACTRDFQDNCAVRRQGTVVKSDVALGMINSYLGADWGLAATGAISDASVSSAISSLRPVLRNRLKSAHGYPGDFERFYADRPGLTADLQANSTITYEPLKLSHLNMDILDTDELCYQMTKQETVVVINAAGKFGGPHGTLPKNDYENLFSEYCLANNAVAISAFEAALKAGVKRFVQIVYDAALVARPEAILNNAHVKIRANAYFKSQVQLIKDLRMLAASAISSGADIDLIFVGVPTLTIGPTGDSGFFSQFAASGNPLLGGLMECIRDNFDKSTYKYYSINRDFLQLVIRGDKDGFQELHGSSPSAIGVDKSYMHYWSIFEDLKRTVRDTLDRIFGANAEYPIPISEIILYIIDGSLDTQPRSILSLSGDGNMSRRLSRIVEHLSTRHNMAAEPRKTYGFLPQRNMVRVHPVAVGVLVWDIAASWVLERQNGSPKIYRNNYIESMVGRKVVSGDMRYDSVSYNKVAELMAPHLFEEVGNTNKGVYSFFLSEFSRTTRMFREDPQNRRISDDVRYSILRQWGMIPTLIGNSTDMFTFLYVNPTQTCSYWASPMDWYPVPHTIDSGNKGLFRDYIYTPSPNHLYGREDENIPRPFGHNWVASGYTSRLAKYRIECTPLARCSLTGNGPRNLAFQGDNDSGVILLVQKVLIAMNIYREHVAVEHTHILSL